MENWQDILLVLIFTLNGVVAYQATRIYKTQKVRIDNLNSQIEELKSANFGTIEEIVKPIKTYIDLLEGIGEKQRDLLQDDVKYNINKILAVCEDNSENIEILVKTRLSNAEALSQATKYPDSNA
jgi:hypothetical protein